MPKEITKKEIDNIAQLANLNLSDEETNSLSSALTDTLKYINVMDELALKDTEETFSVTGSSNVFMNGDENVKTLTQEQALSNSKKNTRGLFVTNAVFDR